MDKTASHNRQPDDHVDDSIMTVGWLDALSAEGEQGTQSTTVNHTLEGMSHRRLPQFNNHQDNVPYGGVPQYALFNGHQDSTPYHKVPQFNSHQDNVPYGGVPQYPLFNDHQDSTPYREVPQYSALNNHQNDMRYGGVSHQLLFSNHQVGIPYRKVPQYSALNNHQNDMRYGGVPHQPLFSNHQVGTPYREVPQYSAMNNHQNEMRCGGVPHQPPFSNHQDSTPYMGAAQYSAPNINQHDILVGQASHDLSFNGLHGFEDSTFFNFDTSFDFDASMSGNLPPNIQYPPSTNDQALVPSGNRPQPVYDEAARQQQFDRQQRHRAQQIELSLSTHPTTGRKGQSHETQTDLASKKRQRIEDKASPTTERVKPSLVMYTLCTGETLTQDALDERIQAPDFPPITDPIPEGIETENIIRHYPNHLWGSIVLRAAKHFSLTEIAAMNGANIEASTIRGRIVLAKQGR